MPGEILVIGEAHPKQTEKNLINERNKTFRNYEGYLKLSFLKGVLRKFKDDPLKFVKLLSPPLYFIRINKESIQTKIKEFTKFYENLTKYPQRICESECDVIRRYRPDTIFVEDMKGREDIKEVADSINAKIIPYKHPDMILLTDETYEKYLLECLLLAAYPSKKSVGIIGSVHLKKARDLLKERKFETNCITYCWFETPYK